MLPIFLNSFPKKTLETSTPSIFVREATRDAAATDAAAALVVIGVLLPLPAIGAAVARSICYPVSEASAPRVWRVRVHVIQKLGGYPDFRHLPAKEKGTSNSDQSLEG